ncbi:copper resistance CopC family protein [Micromonospora sp. NPDC050397]|uniref:copper resistance CopC family protein n=1 Tax=Micromonospora sp. NPDC050397 TaxID=3364279 RepID=UPI00384A493C
MRSTPARLSAALAATLLGLTLSLLGTAPAGAARAATLRESDPGANQTVERLPEVITLVFDESPASTRISVKGPDGTDVVSSPPNIRGVGVRQPVRPGAAGTYTVSYEMSPVTGPPAVGSFSFTVRQAGPAPAPSGAAPPTAPSVPVGSPSGGGVTPPATPAASGTAGTDPAGSTPSARAGRDSAEGGSGPLVAVLVLLGLASVATVVVLVLRARRGTA